MLVTGRVFGRVEYNMSLELLQGSIPLKALDGLFGSVGSLISATMQKGRRLSALRRSRMKKEKRKNQGLRCVRYPAIKVAMSHSNGAVKSGNSFLILLHSGQRD